MTCLSAPVCETPAPRDVFPPCCLPTLYGLQALIITLSSHQELRHNIAEPPRITYRHSPNLSQLLVRAKCNHTISTDLPTVSPPIINPPTYQAKNIFCRHQQCQTCNQLSNRSHCSSFQTKHYYSIPDIFSCDTTGAIYLLDSTISHKQYVGETHTTIRNRMKHHQNMQRATERPIYAHLQSHNSTFSIFQITIIDCIPDNNSRKKKEQYYIQVTLT